AAPVAVTAGGHPAAVRTDRAVADVLLRPQADPAGGPAAVYDLRAAVQERHGDGLAAGAATPMPVRPAAALGEKPFRRTAAVAPRRAGVRAHRPAQQSAGPAGEQVARRPPEQRRPVRDR